MLAFILSNVFYYLKHTLLWNQSSNKECSDEKSILKLNVFAYNIFYTIIYLKLMTNSLLLSTRVRFSDLN